MCSHSHVCCKPSGSTVYLAIIKESVLSPPSIFFFFFKKRSRGFIVNFYKTADRHAARSLHTCLPSKKFLNCGMF